MLTGHHGTGAPSGVTLLYRSRQPVSGSPIPEVALMMNLPNVGIVAFSLVLLGGPLHAHHAFSAEFDANQPVTVNGSVTKVEWQNPHARVYLAVNVKAGSATSWELELPSPN